MNAHTIVGLRDVLFITLDTLRYDVACRARIPNLRRWLPNGQWEARHSPGSFTYAAHHAFFAGFLPTPAYPGKHERLFAVNFSGSTTISPNTYVFDTPDIVSGFASVGYHTVCIGGVNFFDKQNALSQTLPGLFAESHWDASLGAADPHSTRNQVKVALNVLERTTQRLFLFINISAIHQPNYFYLSGAQTDSMASHQAALEYVDAQLAPLLEAMQRRAPTFVLLFSDHGTTYGEDGFYGHRLAHPMVWTVPYAEFML